MRHLTLAHRFQLPHLRAVLAAAVILTLILGILFVLAWPAITNTLSFLTGEEDVLHQIKGLGDLVGIRLTERPLQLAPESSMPYTGTNPFGVSTFLEQEADEANVRRSLEMIQAAGFGWIRQQFPWEDIEIDGKGDFEDRRTVPYKSAWLKYDRIVELASEYGIQILARLDAPPKWSRADRSEDGTFAPPDNLEDYGDFVEAVLRRYKGRIRAIQVWNEPNIYPEWGNRPPDPEGYVELLKVAYRRAKAVDPDVIVLSAPLAPTLDRTDRALRDLDYLERMYAAGARDYFDVLGAIAYGLGTGPTNRRVIWHQTNFPRVELLRDMMVRHGDAAKPIWIVEFGWDAVPAEMPAPFGRVTEAQQARYAVLAYDRMVNEWPWVGVGFIWYFRRPNTEWELRPEGYFRLVGPNWQPQPIYAALKDYANRPSVVPPGFYQEDHWALHWEGGWQTVHDPAAVLGAFKQATESGATLYFAFNGTDLDLVIRPGALPQSVTVDGRAVVPRQQITPTGQPVIAVAHGLADSLHQVTIVASGPLAVDGLIVQRDNNLWERTLTFVGLALLAGVGAVVLGFVLRHQLLTNDRPRTSHD
jgi:hypothetical protein